MTYLIDVSHSSRRLSHNFFRNLRQARDHVTLVKTYRKEQAKGFGLLDEAEAVRDSLARRFPGLVFTIVEVEA
jgi:hypothetical protein